MSCKDAAGEMLAITREINGAGARAATALHAGEARCGCEPTTWQEQMAEISSTPIAARQRSRCSTISRQCLPRICPSRASETRRGSTQVPWRGARLRLVECCRVQTRAISCLHAPVHTHSTPFANFLFFTPTQYGTFIHTPPQHNPSLITHRVIHRLRVLHRHGVSAGASPGSLLASGGAEVVRGLPPCRCKKERNHRAVIPFRSASRCASVGSRLWPGPQSVCAGG